MVIQIPIDFQVTGVERLKQDIASIKSDLAQPFKLEVTPTIDAQQFHQTVQTQLNKLSAVPITINLEISQALTAITQLNQQLQTLRQQFQQPIQVAAPQVQVGPGQGAGAAAAAVGAASNAANFAVPQAAVTALGAVGVNAPNNQSARSIGNQVARVSAATGVPVADVLHILNQAGIPVAAAPITAGQGVNIALDSISRSSRAANQAQRAQESELERQQAAVSRVTGRFGVGDFLRQTVLGDAAAIKGFGGRLGAEEAAEGFQAGSLNTILQKRGLESAIDFRRAGNTDVLRSAAFNLTFGGPGAAIASLAGGITPLGAQGANLAGLAFQGISGIISPVVDAVQELGRTFSESGQLFQQAVLTVGSILQSSQQFVTASGTPLAPNQQLAFQEEEATRIQQLTIQKLRKFGIGGAQESTLLGSVVSGLGQRGFVGSPEQIATITERLAATIQVLRPTLLDRPANLQREVQDFLAGGALAQRTALAPLVRPTINEVTRATSIEDIERATEKLQSYVDTALTTTNPAAVQFRFRGAQETVTQEGGKAFIDAITPGLIEATKVLQSDELKESFKQLGASIGDLAGKAVAASTEISKAAAVLGNGAAGVAKNLFTPTGLIGASVATAIGAPLLFRGATAVPGLLRGALNLPTAFNTFTQQAAFRALGPGLVSGGGLGSVNFNPAISNVGQAGAAVSALPGFIGPVQPVLRAGILQAALREIAKRGLGTIVGSVLTGPLGIGVNAGRVAVDVATELVATSQDARLNSLTAQAEKVREGNLNRKATDQLTVDAFTDKFGLKEKVADFNKEKRTTASTKLAEFASLESRVGTTPAFEQNRDFFNLEEIPAARQREFQDIQSASFIGGPSAKGELARIRREEISPEILNSLNASRVAAFKKASDALIPTETERKSRQVDITRADKEIEAARIKEARSRETLRTAQGATADLQKSGFGFLDSIVNNGLIDRLTNQQFQDINRRRAAEKAREGLPSADDTDVKGLREALQDAAAAELKISQEKKLQLELSEQETEAARERVNLVQQQFITSTAGGKGAQTEATLFELDKVLNRLNTTGNLTQERIGEVGSEIVLRKETIKNLEEEINNAIGKGKNPKDAQLALDESKSILFRKQSEINLLLANAEDQPLKEGAIRTQQQQLRFAQGRVREEEINEIAARLSGQTFQERDTRFALQREATQEGINSRLRNISDFGPNAKGNDAVQQRQAALEALGLISTQRQTTVNEKLDQFSRKSEETQIRELQLQQREAIVDETRKRKELNTSLDASKGALERFAQTAQNKALGKEGELLGIADQLKAIGADVPFELDISADERKRFQEAALRSRGNELGAELGKPTLFGLGSQTGLGIAKTVGDSPFAKQLDLEKANLKAAIERTTIELEKLPLALQKLNEALEKAEFLRSSKETPLGEKLPIELQREGARLGSDAQEKALRDAQGLLPRGVSQFLKDKGIKLGEATSLQGPGSSLFDASQKTLFADINKIGSDQGKFGFARGAGEALFSNLDPNSRKALEASFDKDSAQQGLLGFAGIGGGPSFQSTFNDVFAEQVSGTGTDTVSKEFPKLAEEIRKLVGKLDNKAEAGGEATEQQKLTQSIQALIAAINSAKSSGLTVSINETSLALSIAQAIDHNVSGGGPSPPSGVP